MVIGGGSAGLKAARTAAWMGRTVAVAEERELGGECFWAGCVPTKAMVRAAQVWHLVRRAEEFGIQAEIRQADFGRAMDYKRWAVCRVAGDGAADAGLSQIGVAYFPARASFVSPHEVRVGDNVISGKQIILATGTVPAVPPVPGLTEVGYITNREAVDLETLPKRLVVLGAGPIGLEFAQVFRRFGATVTVIERAPQILPKEDEEIAGLAAEVLREEGIHLLLSATAERAYRVGGEKRVVVRHGEAMEELGCDEILVATGRRPAVMNMGIEAAGILVEPQGVAIDAYQRTSIPHIWATGDVNGGPLFTHVASYEGKLVALNACGDVPIALDYRCVPRCTFLDPEVASIGLTEREAREQGLPVAVHAASFAHLDRAVLHNENRGLVKLVVNARDGQLLGAHLLGHEVSSLLAELAVCMRNAIPLSGIANTMHAYPTFPEAVEAAALSLPREM